MRGSVMGDRVTPLLIVGRNMESKSEIEVIEGLNNPAVDQDSKAMKTIYQSTRGMDPDVSNDVLPDPCNNQEHEQAMSTNFILESVLDGTSENDSNSPTEQNRYTKPTNRLENSEGSLEATEIDNELSIINIGKVSGIANESGVVSMHLSTHCKKLECQESKAEAHKYNLIEELQEGQHAGNESEEEGSDDDDSSSEYDEEYTMDIDDDNNSTEDVNNKRRAGDVDDSSFDSGDEAGTRVGEAIAEHEQSKAGSSCNVSKDTHDTDKGAKVTRFRHPNCKHSMEELERMSQNLKSSFTRKTFVNLSYRQGLDPAQMMEHYLSQPEDEVNDMIKLLPTTKLRNKLRKAVLLAGSPKAFMRQHLSNPESQELLLCNYFHLTDSEILSKVCQQPVVSPVSKQRCSEEKKPISKESEHILSEVSQTYIVPRIDKGISGCEESRSETLKSAENLDYVAPIENEMTASEELKPDTSRLEENVSPSTGTFKEWFSRFLEDGMPVGEAIGRIKELMQKAGLLTGEVAKLSRKQKKKRSRKFRKFNMEQLKDYNHWREEGLVHQDALVKVLVRWGLTGEIHKKKKKRTHVCKRQRKSRARMFAQLPEDLMRVYNGLRERGLSHSDACFNVRHRARNRVFQKTMPSEKSVRSGPHISLNAYNNVSTSGDPSGHRSIGLQPPPAGNVPARSMQRGSEFPNRVLENDTRPSYLPCSKLSPFKRRENDTQPSCLPGSEPTHFNHPILGKISLPQNMQKCSSIPLQSVLPGSKPSQSIHPIFGGTLLPQPCLDVPTPSYGISRMAAPSKDQSNYLKRENVSEKHGALVRSGFLGVPINTPLKSAANQKRLDQNPQSTSNVFGAISSRFVEEPSHPLKPAGTHPKHEQDPALSGDTLCIVPSGYPDERLTEEQMDAIESSILEAIIEIDDESVKPIFKGSFRNYGRYGIICHDQLAKRWLYKYSTCMCQPWPNASLKIIPFVNESRVRANTLLPPCKNDSNDQILKFIARQNKGLNISQWEVVQRRDCVASTSLSLEVDAWSAKTLKNMGKMNFKMGKVNIELIENLEAKHGMSSVSSWSKSVSVHDSSSLVSVPHGGNWGEKLATSRSSLVGSLQAERVKKIPQDKSHFGTGESSRIGSLEHNQNMERYRQYRPHETPSNQSSELHERTYLSYSSRSGSCDSQRSHRPTKRSEHSHLSWRIDPESSRQPIHEINESEGWAVKNRSSGRGRLRYGEPCDVSRQYLNDNEPRSFSRSYSPGETSKKYIEVTQRGWSPRNDMFQEEPAGTPWGSASASVGEVRAYHGLPSSRSSLRSPQVEHVEVPREERPLGFGTPSRRFLGAKRPVEPSMHDQPREKRSHQNPKEFHEPRYVSPSSRSCDTEEDQGYGKYSEYVGPSWSDCQISPRQPHQESYKSKIRPARSSSPEYSRSGFIEPHGVSRLRVDEPRGSRSSPGGPSMHIEQSLHYRSSSNDYFEERPALEPSTGIPQSSASVEYRSYKNRSACDEPSGSSRFYRTPYREPSVESRFDAYEYFSNQQTAGIRPPSNEQAQAHTSYQPQEIPWSGGHIERDRSPLGSSFSTRSEHRKRSHRSPPPPPPPSWL